ncbi:GNAT family N-acetyltransferase [Phenylobacterium sp. VNQ135]|uniref:GNAT family N-acetyltransferase n=1 Tax=Phenylobacterium sp. VNQ135 TaxID=3400922 RepID=UPI003C066C8E
MASQTPTFRPAAAEDLPMLHRLVESAYRGESARAGWTHEADLLETPRTSAETLARIIARPGEVILLALHGEAVAGCVQVSRVADDRAYLGLLAVDPIRQAGGLGRAIIAAAEAWAVERWGAAVMELSVVSVRAELIAYYERRGYRLTGETRPFPAEVEPPLELAVMEKPLGS